MHILTTNLVKEELHVVKQDKVAAYLQNWFFDS